jgi:hypothetical protein
MGFGLDMVHSKRPRGFVQGNQTMLPIINLSEREQKRFPQKPERGQRPDAGIDSVLE